MKILFNGFNKYEPSEIYLCTPNRKELAFVHGTNATCVLRLNDISEISLNVYKYLRTSNGEKIEQPCYSLIKTKRLLHVTNIGWFEIKEAVESHDEEGEYITITAYSHQYSFQNKGFYVEDRLYSFYNSADPTDENYDASDTSAIPSVIGQLYQQLGIKLDLQYNDVTIDTDYDNWTIVYIDPNIRFPEGADSVYRSLSENTLKGYEFMVNTVESAFEIIWIFDFEHHAIKVKTVPNITTQTDIYLSFDNLVKSLEVTENADDLITVLNCSGTDLDIRTVNPMGTSYIVNFDYYKDKDGNWMSQELIEVLDNWKTLYDSKIVSYQELVKELREEYGKQTQYDVELQKAQLKIDELSNARDQYIDNYPLLAETKYIGELSDDPSGNLHTIFFAEDLEFVCYSKAPTAKNSQYIFNSVAYSGTLKDNFTNGHIYFQDGDITTYCKLIKNDEGILGYERYGQFGNIYQWCALSENTEVIVSAEIVDNNQYSLDEESNFYQTPFDGSSNALYTLYKTSPILDETKKFKGEGDSIQGTLDDGRSAGYLYFLDGSTNTYCKIIEAAVVDTENIDASYYVSGFIRYTLISSVSRWINLHEDNYEIIESYKKSIENEADLIYSQMKEISSECNILSYVAKADPSGSLSRELECYWIEGDYTNETLAVLEDTTLEESIDLATELMKNGEAQLLKKSQPSFSFTVEAIDFTKLKQFERFTEELALGRTISVEKSNGVTYLPALTEIAFDIYDANSFAMTFSNSAKLNSNEFTFADLVAENSRVAKSVSSNWQDLISYSKEKEIINSLLANPLDKTLRAGLSNMVNQEFTIDNTGILGRKYLDETKTDFSKEQMRIMNNNILFTDDEWETIRTALGRIYYEENGVEKTAYGLIAETIVGSLIVGETLNIKNLDSSIELNSQGIVIKSNNEPVFSANVSGEVELVGKITALEGYIGDKESGFKIDSNSISHNLDETGTRVLVCTGSTEQYQVSGSDLIDNWMLLAGEHFGVTTDGHLYASVGSIAGLEMKSDAYESLTYNCDVSGSISPSYISVNPQWFLGYNESASMRFDYDGTYWYVTDLLAQDDLSVQYTGTPTVGDTITVSDTTKGGRLISVSASTTSTSVTFVNGTVSTSTDENGKTVTTCSYSGGQGATVVPTVAILGDPVTVTYAIYYYGEDGHWGRRMPILLSNFGITIAGFTENNPYKTEGGNSGGTIIRPLATTLSDESYTPVEGDYIIVTANAVHSYENNGLYSEDFKLITGTQTTSEEETKNNTGLYFWDGVDENTQELNFVTVLDKLGLKTTNGSFDTINSTQSITTSELVSNTLATSGQVTIGGISLVPKELSDETIQCYADLSWDGDVATVKIYNAATGGLTVSNTTRTFLVEFQTNTWAKNVYTYGVTIYTGKSSGSIDLGWFWGIRNAWYYSGGGTREYFTQKAKSSGDALSISGSIVPEVGGARSLGTATYYWANLYVDNFYENAYTFTGSDARIKNTIEDMSEKYSELFDLLRPVTFKYNNGTSGRTHMGLIANELKDAIEAVGLSTQDVAAYGSWTDDDGNETCGIRYGELISLNIYEIQKLKARIAELEEKLNKQL